MADPYARRRRDDLDTRPSGLDLVHATIRRAARMSKQEQADVMKPFRTAYAALASGRGDQAAWSSMADMCNLAEALAELRIGSNLVNEIEQAHAALAAVINRVHAGGDWAMHAIEIAALGECVVIYVAQLEVCSLGEHTNAEALVRRRIASAMRVGAGKHGKQLIHATPPAGGPRQ